VICFTFLPPRRFFELPHGKIRKRRKYKENKGRKSKRLNSGEKEKGRKANREEKTQHN